MNAYGNLARSYDRLTRDVDYRATVEFYEQILENEGCRPRTAVDLACGTGSIALILAEKSPALDAEFTAASLKITEQELNDYLF